MGHANAILFGLSENSVSELRGFCRYSPLIDMSSRRFMSWRAVYRLPGSRAKKCPTIIWKTIPHSRISVCFTLNLRQGELKPGNLAWIANRLCYVTAAAKKCVAEYKRMASAKQHKSPPGHPRYGACTRDSQTDSPVPYLHTLIHVHLMPIMKSKT